MKRNAWPVSKLSSKAISSACASMASAMAWSSSRRLAPGRARPGGDGGGRACGGAIVRGGPAAGDAAEGLIVDRAQIVEGLGAPDRLAIDDMRDAVLAEVRQMALELGQIGLESRRGRGRHLV